MEPLFNPGVERKEPLDRETLRDVIELALWTGQILLHAGAQSARVERTVHRMGTALGADWMDIVVMPEGLMVTTVSGEEFRTRIRRVVSLSVNLALIAEINALSRKVAEGKLDRFQVRRELQRLESLRVSYPRWLVVLMVGLACAAFSRLFGGDWLTFGVTFAASSAAMFVRQTLTRTYLNTLLVIMVTAFVAGVIPGAASLSGLLLRPETALAASVLLLVPGVPLINAARDILRGYIVTGMARGIWGFVISLCIALGLLVALQVTGVSGLDTTTTVSRDPLSFLLADALWSGVAALGFAVLFNVPRQYLPYCALAGAAGHALRALLLQSGVAITSGTLAGALLVGLLGEFFAQRMRSPAGMFAVPAAIPMVPGVFAFRAMIGVIDLTIAPTGADTRVLVEAITNFAITGLVLAALAVGIAMPSLIGRRQKPVV